MERQERNYKKRKTRKDMQERRCKKGTTRE